MTTKKRAPRPQAEATAKRGTKAPEPAPGDGAAELPVIRMEVPPIEVGDEPPPPPRDKARTLREQLHEDEVMLARLWRSRAPIHAQFIDALTPRENVRALRELPPLTQAEREISARSLRYRLLAVLGMRPRRAEGDALGRYTLEVPDALIWQDFAMGYQVGEFVPALEHMHSNDSDGASWLWSLLLFGQSAILEAAAELVMQSDLSKLETNTLSAIGNAVSLALRREILLETLYSCRWNMARVAAKLRMGYGSAPVLRAIKELGLTEEYEAAKRDGLIKVGGKRKRAPG